MPKIEDKKIETMNISNKYIKINFDILKDMESLVRFETYGNGVIIKGLTKDHIEIEYNTSVSKALKIGLIEKEGL